MERNTKLAIGCGGAGCLGLIVIVIACVILYSTGYIAMPGSSDSNRNENYNATNTNSNSNSNANSNSNLNENSNSSSSSSTSLTNDDRHKLFQAAGMSRDNALIQRVLHKLGLLTPGNDLSDDYAPFTKAHVEWAKNNTAFIQSVLTPEKARAYVDAHMND
jgi:hypothetical protein